MVCLCLCLGLTAIGEKKQNTDIYSSISEILLLKMLRFHVEGPTLYYLDCGVI